MSDELSNQPNEPSYSITPEPTFSEQTFMILSDEPLESDAILGFDKFSKKIAQIIRNSPPRFSIGIFGRWGTGKTTLMKMIQRELESDEPSNVATIWFDAWKYERENYLAIVPFIRTICIELKNTQTKDHKWRKIEDAFKKTLDAFASSTTIGFEPEVPVKVGLDIDKLIEALKSDGSVNIGNKKIYYYRHFTENLSHELEKIRKDNKELRIVVFIDDLDRCTPEKALEVLESIKTFFDIEGIVYVIGMNTESIDFLIKEKYGENATVTGRDYIEKIIQLPFFIPPWDENDLAKYLQYLISTGFRESKLRMEFDANMEVLKKAIEKTQETQRDLLTILF